VPKFKKTSLWFIKLAIYLVPVFLLSWLISRDVVSSGELDASYDFTELSPFVSVLRPADRVEEPIEEANGNIYQTITNQPVYFDVRRPRRFDTARVTISYRNHDQPVFQLGALVDNEIWQFDLKPLENKALDQLYNDKLHWTSLRQGKTVLFQQGEEYLTVQDFLGNRPDPNRIAIYNHNIDQDFRLPNYRPSSPDEPLVINKSLRGRHRLLVYLENEPLDINFLIQDTNRSANEDFIDLKVLSLDGGLVFDKFISDDGLVEERGVYQAAEAINLQVPDLAAGVYRIEFSTTDDVFIRQITSRQHKLVFIDDIYLADNVGYSDDFDQQRLEPSSIFTNGRRFDAYTSHIEGLQAIRLADEVVTVSQTHQKFGASLPDSKSAKSVYVPKNDIRLSTKGLWSFSHDSFFNPFLRDLADGEPVDANTISYVLADYEQPVYDGEWRQATVEFPARVYYQADNKLHFVLSLPYLQLGDKGIDINSIQVSLIDKPLSVKEILSRVLNKIKGE
tara:strand:- start:828 stop:2345 length:1518 start_codon:yes stop_codon:yes gene_type:complete